MIPESPSKRDAKCIDGGGTAPGSSGACATSSCDLAQLDVARCVGFSSSVMPPPPRSPPPVIAKPSSSSVAVGGNSPTIRPS